MFYGIFRHPYARDVFTQGAARLMPDVGFLLLDGANPEGRTAALSAADVFLFLIDNIQESFGLAPMEGMAAGLPLLVSDWDSMKDTVTPDVGFRVKTRTLGPQHLANESMRLQGGIDNYSQYSAAVSAMTEVDMPDLKARILDLATNPDLRAQYNWSAVIPQFQALWAEQDARRRAGFARTQRTPVTACPSRPRQPCCLRITPPKPPIRSKTVSRPAI